MTTRKTQSAGRQAARRSGQNRQKTGARRPGGKLEVVPAEPTLPELASTANQEHAWAEKAGLSMVEHALLAGQALLEAKSQVKHGQWGAWLEASFEASERTAQAYMKLAKNPQRVADLEEPSLRKSLLALRAPSNDDDDKTVDRTLQNQAEAAAAKAKSEAEREPKDQRKEFEALARLVHATSRDSVVVELLAKVTALVESVGEDIALERVDGLLVSA